MTAWLAALAQGVLAKEPFPGHVFVFRGQRGDIIKPESRTDMGDERRQLVHGCMHRRQVQRGLPGMPDRPAHTGQQQGAAHDLLMDNLGSNQWRDHDWITPALTSPKEWTPCSKHLWRACQTLLSLRKKGRADGARAADLVASHSCLSTQVSTGSCLTLL
ncbi:MAG: hypothetical protein I8H87_02220 [Comamonadaceae bacterium]|nr:hypothetical protein [Comamonadaceae bacterium]